MGQAEQESSLLLPSAPALGTSPTSQLSSGGRGWLSRGTTPASGASSFHFLLFFHCHPQGLAAFAVASRSWRPRCSFGSGRAGGGDAPSQEERSWARGAPQDLQVLARVLNPHRFAKRGQASPQHIRADTSEADPDKAPSTTERKIFSQLMRHFSTQTRKRLHSLLLFVGLVKTKGNHDSSTTTLAFCNACNPDTGRLIASAH